MEKTVSMRILHLKNNFYRDDASVEKNPLGEYCVIGYFDAFDTLEAATVEVTESDSWDRLGELTSQLDGTVNSRTLVCITEQQEKDRVFWEDQSDALLFITMVRVKAGTSAKEMKSMMDELEKTEKRICYLSYDHSEIIVAAKMNRYSDGIKEVKKLHNIYGAAKTYTIFAVMEEALESYETICEKIEDEEVYCRWHCMVREYEKAKAFKRELEKELKKRNGETIKVNIFETFGGYDWVMELNAVSICSVLACYRMGNLLTHANKIYNSAFYNIESEILVKTGGNDGGSVDRRTETTTEKHIS